MLSSLPSSQRLITWCVVGPSETSTGHDGEPKALVECFSLPVFGVVLAGEVAGTEAVARVLERVKLDGPSLASSCARFELSFFFSASGDSVKCLSRWRIP